MGFLDRFFSRKAATTSEDIWREIYGGKASKSGVTVTVESALQASVALACARAIANGLSSIPFKLMQESGDSVAPARDQKLYELMAMAPNEWQTSVGFFEQIAFHLVFCGNAYVFKNSVGGEVTELLPYPPGNVRTLADGWRLRYFVQLKDGAEIEIPAADMWHLRGPSWDGVKGMEGVALAREALGMSIAAEMHGSSTFANGVQLGGLLTTEQALNTEQRRMLRETWHDTHGGAGNAGKTAVMSHGMKFTASQASNIDSQWLEARRFQVEEICRAFGVWPIMAFYSDKATTYASASAMFDAHVKFTMLRWYRDIETSAAIHLLTPEQRASGLYFQFFPQGLMRANATERGEFYAALYNTGAINPNEIRKLEDMNPYPGGEKFRVPLNMADPNAPLAPQAQPGAQGNTNGTT